MAVPKVKSDPTPELFDILEEKEDTYPSSRLERLETLPLDEQPLLLVCMDNPEPHIRILWRVHYVTPYFNHTTP